MVLPEGRIEGDWLLRFAELRVCDGLSGRCESEVPVPFDAPSRQEAASSPSFWWASQILERALTMMNYHDPSKRGPVVAHLHSARACEHSPSRFCSTLCRWRWSRFTSASKREEDDHGSKS